MVCYNFDIFWLVAVHNQVLVTNKRCLSFVLVVDVRDGAVCKGLVLIMESFGLGHVFLRVIRLSLVFIISPMFHSHLLVYHRHYIITATDSVVK